MVGRNIKVREKFLFTLIAAINAVLAPGFYRLKTIPACHIPVRIKNEKALKIGISRAFQFFISGLCELS